MSLALAFSPDLPLDPLWRAASRHGSALFFCACPWYINHHVLNGLVPAYGSESFGVLGKSAANKRATCKQSPLRHIHWCLCRGAGQFSSFGGALRADFIQALNMPSVRVSLGCHVRGVFRLSTSTVAHNG